MPLNMIILRLLKANSSTCNFKHVWLLSWNTKQVIYIFLLDLNTCFYYLIYCYYVYIMIIFKYSELKLVYQAAFVK